MRPSSHATTELRQGVLSGQAVMRLRGVLLAPGLRKMKQISQKSKNRLRAPNSRFCETNRSLLHTEHFARFVGLLLRGRLPHGQLPRVQLPRGQLPRGQLRRGKLPRRSTAPRSTAPVVNCPAVNCPARQLTEIAHRGS